MASPEAHFAAGDPFAANAANSAVNLYKPLLLIGLILIAWSLVVFIAGIRTARVSPGMNKGAVFGYFIGTLLMPILIATFLVWLINRLRKSKLTSPQRHLWAAFGALGLSVLSLAGQIQDSPGLDNRSLMRHMGHLMKQAAGQEPVPRASEWYEEPTREMYRELLRFNRDYTAAVHAVGTASTSNLYTVDSYKTQSALRATIVDLQALSDIDKKYQSLDPILKQIEVNVGATSVSVKDKDAFLQGLRESVLKSSGPRDEAVHAEEAWLQSAIQLYAFALSHFDDYEVREKKVIFRNHEARVTFEDLQSKSIGLHKTALEAKQRFDKARKEYMTAAGLNSSDLPSAPATEK